MPPILSPHRHGGVKKLNKDITAPQMLVVWERPGGNGTDSVVMTRTQALDIATRSKLDLVMSECWVRADLLGRVSRGQVC